MFFKGNVCKSSQSGKKRPPVHLDLLGKSIYRSHLQRVLPLIFGPDVGIKVSFIHILNILLNIVIHDNHYER